MIGKGGAGDLPCRGVRGTLSGGQCEGAPCLSLFPKEVGWLYIRKENMTQKDYNPRVAEDVGLALAQIIYHKEIHDYQGALSLIDESFKQAVGAGSGFIHAISEKTLLAMLTLLDVLN